MRIKTYLFFLLVVFYANLSAQEGAGYFRNNYISSLQFADREHEPYNITEFSVEAQSAGELDKYDLSKFTKVREVSCKFFSNDSLLQTVLKKLSRLPALEAIEITEYPIFPPMDRSKFGQTKFPNEIALFKNLKAIKFSLLKNYDWEDILTKLSSLPSLEELNISLSYFKKIPVALRKLSNIRSLTIYDNEWIETFPEWITEFKKLEHLNISQNPKLDYAGTFNLLSKIPGLHSIELSYCRFDEIPSTIANMRSLRKLSATGLNVKNWDGFFTTLSALPELKELWMRVGDSIILPASIGGLKKLEQLSLDSRKITVLPEEIGQLTELRTLSIEGNHLKELPQSFYQLKKLESVNLGYNHFESLSDDIQLLKNIESLQLTKNNLKALPVSIGALQKCKRLLLSYNQISALPVSISSMGLLEELSVANNRLSGLFADFSGLRQLVKLHASNNAITMVDLSIGKLANLTTLLLENNLIENLPGSVCSLRKLETLSINYNRLRELPADMGKLENLEALDISSDKTGNSFRYLPASLGSLKKLKTLTLRNNQSLDGDSAIRVVYRMQSPIERFDMSACNISSLPETGWADCRVLILDLGNNNIKTVPVGLLDIPKLRFLRLSGNPLPQAFKTDWSSKEQFMVTAAENGLLKNFSVLPHTADMCKALYEVANTHFNYGRYDKTIFLYSLADSLFDEATIKSLGRIRQKGHLGIAQYHLGQYEKAISNISVSLREDTALQVRIMNFINPQFEGLVQSYLAIKDTISAIDVYRKWSQMAYNPDASAQAALLSSFLGNKTDATELALKAADQYRKSRDKDPFTLLSILEVFVINEMHDSARNFVSTVDTAKFSKEQKVLMEYLLQVHRILNKTSSGAELSRLLEKIESLGEKKNSWSYDFFESWLNKAVMDTKQKAEIRQLTNAIKRKIHS